MINRILMELYDDYNQNNINTLIEFTKKTFPSDGTDQLFIGCVLILFSRCNGFKPRYDATREHLLSIVLAAKEKIGSSNLLAFYMDRMNRKKGIDKYLKNVIHDSNIEQYADLIIEYLEQFKPDFISELKKKNKTIEHYIHSLQQGK